MSPSAWCIAVLPLPSLACVLEPKSMRSDRGMHSLDSLERLRARGVVWSHGRRQARWPRTARWKAAAREEQGWHLAQEAKRRFKEQTQEEMVAVLNRGIPAGIEDQAYRALFLVVMALAGLAGGMILDSAILGLVAGLVIATFVVGPATLKRSADGSWTLIKRS